MTPEILTAKREMERWGTKSQEKFLSESSYLCAFSASTTRPSERKVDHVMVQLQIG